MSETLTNYCTHCETETEWRKVLETKKTGRKGGRDRDPTTKEVFECSGCGMEGRRFVDGVDGTVTFSGGLEA